MAVYFLPLFAMGKKNISDDMKRHILDLRHEGVSIGDIAKSVGLSKSTIHIWCKQAAICEVGEVPPAFQFHAPGGACSTSPMTDRNMKRTLGEHLFISARLLQMEMQEALGHVVVQKIQHCLQKDLDLMAQWSMHRPMLMRVMKAKRLAFAKKYKDWTFEDGKKLCLWIKASSGPLASISALSGGCAGLIGQIPSTL